MKNQVRAKKHLGQHFLNDQRIAIEIVNSLSLNNYNSVLEIGPGMGVLTQHLLKIPNLNFKCIDVDFESVEWLKNEFNLSDDNLIHGDFLKLNLNEIFENQFAIIGNFPYNISSQILFNMLENKHNIPEMVGMFQKEVAERLASPSGNKSYGILSVLCQAYYDTEYLFTVNEDVFTPPPKVKSAVIRMKRKSEDLPLTDFTFFKKVVKGAFNQRRKMLRNSLQALGIPLEDINPEYLTKRPEQLSIRDFDNICQRLKK